jgi:ankyrin repeat protein
MFTKTNLLFADWLFPLKKTKKPFLKIAIAPLLWLTLLPPLLHVIHYCLWQRALFKKLIEAISTNNFEEVKDCSTFLAYKHLLRKNKEGQNPLLIATQRSTSPIIKALIAKTPLSAFWSCDMLRSRTALHWIAEKGDLENATYILGKVPPLLLAQVDHDGQTPLFIACRERHFSLAQLFTKRSPLDALSIADYFWEITPLCLVCKEGDLATTKLLLEKLPASDLVKSDDFWKKTPLHRACENGHLDIVKALLQKLPKEAIYLKDRDDQTALDLAKENGHLEIANLMQDVT